MSAGIAALGAGANYLADSLREDRKEAEDKRRWEAEQARLREADAVLKALREQQIAESQAASTRADREDFLGRARLGGPASPSDLARGKRLDLESLMEMHGGQPGELPSRQITGAMALPSGLQQGGGVTLQTPLREPGAAHFRRLITPEAQGQLDVAREGMGIDRDKLQLGREELALRKSLGELENAWRWGQINADAPLRRAQADYYKSYAGERTNRAKFLDPRVAGLQRMLNTAMGRAIVPGDSLTGTAPTFHQEILDEAINWARAQGYSEQEIADAVAGATEAGGSSLGARPPGALDPGSDTDFWR